MKNIDFLPNSYRERNALRNARTWWGVVVLVFGTVILSTASVQWTWRRGVERQLDLVEVKYSVAKQRDQELARLQKQIQSASESAGLYTYLQHPWPRTQILATLVSTLPESVRLQELNLGEEALPVAQDEQASSGKRRTTSKESVGPKQSPAQQDLARLKQQCDAQQTVLDVTGMAEDVQQLHAYVSSLGKSPLIAAAQLKSLEAVSSKEDDAVDPVAAPSATQTRFQLHLVIRQGYGQTNGPQPKAAAAGSGKTAAATGGRPSAGGLR